MPRGQHPEIFRLLTFRTSENGLYRIDRSIFIDKQVTDGQRTSSSWILERCKPALQLNPRSAKLLFFLVTDGQENIVNDFQVPVLLALFLP